MKKLLLLAAFGLLATPAFAQNEASVTSTGDDNSASVDQSYTPGDVATVNEATILQVGDEHDAQISQAGAGNISTIDQAGYNHGAAQTQFLGYSNQIDVVQRGGDAASSQWGGNRVNAAFRGDLNDIDINQTGSGNDAYLRMNTQQNDENRVRVDQVGDGNDADMEFASRNDRNTFDMFQHGDNNSIGLWGGGHDGVEFGNDADDNTVRADQVGDWNDADIVLGAGSTFNTIDLDQMSDGNYANISVDGTGNTATVSQN